MSQREALKYLISGGVLGLTTTLVLGASNSLFPSETTSASLAPVTTSSAPPISAAPVDELNPAIFTGSNQQVEQWGNLQVQIKVESGRIVDIGFVAYPHQDRKSDQINAQSLPLLVQAALTAQSADVSHISGATYTSIAFVDSLQSALEAAGI